MPDQEPDQASVSVGHGPAPAPDTDRAVRVADRDQELDSLDQSAREALLAGDAATALRLYERLAREFPEARAARLGQALALERLGRSAEARAVYQSLLQADPEDLGAKIALLGILAERAPDEALQLLRRLARYHPDDHRLAAQIAMVLARTGDLAAAIAAGRQAVALAPGDARYRANLAVLLDRAGQTSAAIEQYQSALELATLAGAPTTQLGAIAARLHHLRQPPPSAPATPGADAAAGVHGIFTNSRLSWDRPGHARDATGAAAGAGPQGAHDQRPERRGNRMDIDRLLQLAIDHAASDLHLSGGNPPLLRIDGEIRPLDAPPLSGGAIDRLLHSVLDEPQRSALRDRARDRRRDRPPPRARASA